MAVWLPIMACTSKMRNKVVLLVAAMNISLLNFYNRAPLDIFHILTVACDGVYSCT